MAELSRLLGSTVKLAAAVVPPALTGASFWSSVQRHPWLAVAVLAIYELGVAAWTFGTKVATELTKRLVPGTADWVEKTVRQRITRHERRYLRHLKETNLYVDLKGFTTRGPYTSTLDRVFVNMSLIPQPTNSVSNAVIDGDDFYFGSVFDDRTISVWDLLRTVDRKTVPLAIIGPPGSGKTTLLKHVALSLARRDRTSNIPSQFRKKIPIVVTLRQYAAHIIEAPSCTVADLVNISLSRAGIIEPAGWLAKQLREGQCVVMLDGLDEVATRTDRQAVVDWVETQILRYPGSHFVLTSRPYGYAAHPINSATFAKLAPFTEGQIDQFISQWYLDTEVRSKGNDSQTIREEALAGADDLTRRLKSSATLYRIAVNPLLLTMVANVHYYRGALPGNRIELYREICQVFLGKRQEAKQLDIDLSTDQKESVLRRLAFEMMKGRQRDVERSEAARLIKSQLARVKPGADPSEFLTSVEQMSGLLYEREDGYYCFAHLTFQEYLTAAYIAENNQAEILAGRVSDEWWRETTLLFVAQYGGDDIMRACLSGERPSATAIALAVDCAAEARELSPDIRQSLERLLAREATDASRRQLVTNVLLIRKMRDSVHVLPSTWLCMSPVTNEEYALFTEDSALPVPALEQPERRNAPPSVVGTDPVLGITREAASMFVNWGRSMIGDLRLPTAEEIKRGLKGSDSTAQDLAIWATHEQGITLYKQHLNDIPDLADRLAEQLLIDTTKVTWLAENDDVVAASLAREVPGRLATLASVALGIDCRNALHLKLAVTEIPGTDQITADWDVETNRGAPIRLRIWSAGDELVELHGYNELAEEQRHSDTITSLLAGVKSLGHSDNGMFANGLDRGRLGELAIQLGNIDAHVVPSPRLCSILQELVTFVADLAVSRRTDKFFRCARVGAASLALSMLYRRDELTRRVRPEVDIPVSDQEGTCYSVLVELLVSLSMLQWRAAGELEPNETLLLVKSASSPGHSRIPNQSTRHARRVMIPRDAAGRRPDRR